MHAESPTSSSGKGPFSNGDSDALAREHEILLFHIGNTPLAVIEWTPDFRVKRWPARAEQIFGWTAAEVTGLHPSEWQFIHPDDLSKTREVLQKLIEGEESAVHSTNRNLHQNGSAIYCDWFNYLRRGAAGEVVAIFSLVLDVTLREQNQRDLRESEERFRLLSRATNDAIWDWDAKSNQVWWNDGFEVLFGFKREEVESDFSSWENRIHPEDRERVIAGFHGTVNSGGSTWTSEYRFRCKDGGYSIVLDKGHVIRDDTGNAVRVVGGMMDITERRKLEAQFLRAQRMESIGTLAGGIAHDLNNLLSPILMGVELLRMDEEDEGKLQLIEHLEVSAKRGTELVRQVLSFARGVEGARVPVDLRDVVEEVQSIILNTFPKDIHFKAESAEDLWLTVGDPTQLNQVLLNLCVNARDAMTDGGSLTVKVYNSEVDAQYAVMARGVAAGRYVVVEVVDNGTGMPKEVQEQIFEPFFTTKGQGNGTGLGLSTVQGIARSHGGFLNVYSEMEKGSVFKLFLPVGENIPQGADGGLQVNLLPRGNGEYVLVVDDEISILTITKQTLEAFGYEVITAEDGAQAIGLFAMNRDKIKTVITDMMMPVMDGPALVAALRRIDPQVCIIAASGMKSEGAAMRAAGAGVKHFLAKPFTADRLLTVLKSVIVEANSQ